MPTGLSTIQRGIGSGGLGTISRGYLTTAAVVVVQFCPETFTITDLAPTLTITDIEPTLAITDLEPTLSISDLEPTLAIIDGEPTLKIEDC